MSLELSRVNFSYDPQQDLLQDISWTLKAGQFSAIIGPNGSGKSTLLTLMAGLSKATSGSIELDGEALENYSRAAIARRLAYLPQRASVTFDFTVREIVAMGRHSRRDHSQTREQVTQALDLLDSLEFQSRIFRTLSGGEQQRVMLARTLCQNQERLLLDEPTSAQDMQHKLLIYEQLASLAKSGAAIAISTHELNLAGLFATDLIVLSQGRIIARGHPKEVLTEQLLAKVFNIRGDFVELKSGDRVFIPTARVQE